MKKALLTLFALVTITCAQSQTTSPDFNKDWAAASAHIQKQDSLINDMRLRTHAFHVQTKSSYTYMMIGLGLTGLGALSHRYIDGQNKEVGQATGTILYLAGGASGLIGSINFVDAYRWFNFNRKDLNFNKYPIK